jgi:hypothetical protein
MLVLVEDAAEAVVPADVQGSVVVRPGPRVADPVQTVLD